MTESHAEYCASIFNTDLQEEVTAMQVWIEGLFEGHNDELSIEDDYELETRTYTFEDGSKITFFSVGEVVVE